ncbi:MAG: heat-inducible transcriptional repressor HrcA [Gemmatimonadota bacterium]
MTDRELRVLEAVIQTYIETAEPAGSQAIARRCGLGVSSATIRNTMSELEERGYLFHPHTSAGRIPTDRGYRAYVDNLHQRAPLSPIQREQLEAEMQGPKSTIEEILRRAAQVLGVLTQELGVAAAPALDETVLERIELVQVASDRLLMVFNLQSGVVRTIFVQIPSSIAPAAVQGVTRILNERLAGLALREIRRTLADRLRDVGAPAGSRELINIFLAEGEDMFALPDEGSTVVLSGATALAEQPEFTRTGRMRTLLELTERRDLLVEALKARRGQGLMVTIGAEHDDPRLADFTLVTAPYRVGELTGVIGVLGPTRMPYDKIIGLVDHTSRLVEGLME